MYFILMKIETYEIGSKRGRKIEKSMNEQQRQQINKT